LSDLCKYDCGRAAEAGKSRCRTCRRSDKASGDGRVLVRESQWDVQVKGGGTATMTSRRFAYPTAPDGPAWPVVQAAAPVSIEAVKWTGPTTGPAKDGWQRAVILPDVQIPYQDEDAVSVALQIVAATDPDIVLWLGDFLDLPEQGKYRQEPRFAQSTQGAIDYGHALLAKTAAAAPRAKQVLLAGNHEARLTNYLLDNAAAAFGIRRANVPEEWPVMSVPYLLRLDELGVEYVDGYPAGEYWINDNLRAIHGTAIGNASRTAAQIVSEQERVSTLFGHTHKAALAQKTRSVFGGVKTTLAASPGCLCRIDGVVPGMKSAIDSAGRVVRSVQDWQQGVGIVDFQPGNGRFSYEHVMVYAGWARFRGTEFSA
jgi:hypothetical protein